MNYKTDPNYIEGKWAGKDIAKKIEMTAYKNLETAIDVKQKLIDNFEKEFGYSKEQDSFDRNYTFNLGILDVLKEKFNEREGL